MASYLTNVGDKISVDVLVVHEIYRKNDFSVLECKPKSGKKFKAVGNSCAEIGKSFHMEGIVAFERGEYQLKVQSCISIMPFDRKSTLFYLKTVKGLKSRAELIVDMFGEDSIEILKNSPEKISAAIKGVGKKSVAEWSKALKAYEVSEAAMIKLLALDITPYFARKLFDNFGADIVNKIEENPFFLVRAVDGFGFVKCDKIAAALGINKENPFRTSEGVMYSFELSESEGHCYLTLPEIIIRAKSILMVEDEYLMQGLNVLMSDKRIVKQDDRFYRWNMLCAEKFSGDFLKEINNHKTLNLEFTDKIVEKILADNNVELELKQKTAITTICKYHGGVFVLNGGAGCGKTFTIQFILKVLNKVNRNYKIEVFAPTGKAAKVAAKAIGLGCKTIHRGLEYKPQMGFSRNENNPILADCIIVDESSMLDIELLYHLLRAVESKTKLIFIGDTNQLPSVGPGKVLKEIINSQVIPVTTLDVIKRQNITSGIVVAALDIIDGKVPTEMQPEFFIRNPKDEIEYMLALVESSLSKGNTLDEIQVLSPMKNGKFGVFYLNYVLQQKLNPHSPNGVIYKTLEVDFLDVFQKINIFLKVGDKVINTKNDYEAKWLTKTSFGYKETSEVGVFNGDCGYIREIIIDEGTKEQKVFVEFEGEQYICFGTATIPSLDLAYALTIHKSQGSEWKQVIIILKRCHMNMLDRNLLYTAETRAKNACVIIGDKSAIEIAVSKNKVINRNTALEEWLTKR